jgi:hypothetical protein
MSTEENKALVRRWVDLWNSQNVAAIDERKAQERINASRFEMDTVKLNWLWPIHDPIVAPQPDPATLATGRKRCSLTL